MVPLVYHLQRCHIFDKLHYIFIANFLHYSQSMQSDDFFCSSAANLTPTLARGRCEDRNR